MATLKQWNYEVSIWTLQDSFITVLKPSNMENKGQLENEDFVIKNDGTLEFSFSIPTWLYLDGERMPNPIWFDSYHGDGIKAILVKNMTKLKVTFNKGRDEEKTFELLITNCEESHENDNVYYNVQSEGMAFHELGKVGYKISLTQDLYDPLHKEWFEGDQTGEEPAANLDFWLQTGMGLEMLPGVEDVDKAIKLVERQHALCSNVKDRGNEINSLYRIDQTLIAIRDAGVISRKAFPYYEVLSSYVTQYEGLVGEDDLKAKNVIDALNAVIAAPKKVDRNKWYYIIDMDWSAYDSSRDRRKIYEEEYTKSWGYDPENNKFSAGDIEKAREKWRNEQINLEESNKYNLTQNLAEIFGVFCRYEYIYDENYYIVGRKIIFYNNFAREQENGYLSLTYPYTASKISRTQETTDLVTKMYVKPVDNEHSLSGLSTIVDVGANKMREDYVMNFDYLKLIGTISDEQYAEIENYEGKIRYWNDKISGLQEEIDNLSNELIKLKAQNQGYIDGQKLAKEQLDQAKDLLESITAKDGTADGKRTIDSSNPKTVILSRDKNNEGQLIAKTKDYYIQVDTLKIYREYDYVNKSFSQNKEIKDFLVDYDDYGNLSYVRVAEKKKDESNENDYALEDGTILYLTYDYIPKLYYEAVEKIWGTNLDINKKGENETTPIIASKEQLLEEKTEALSNYVKEKEKVIAKFEAMMGPALREGFWQPEGYTDGGDKYIDVVNMPIKIGYENGVPGQSGYTTFFWDTVKRNEDYEIEKNYKIGVNQEEKPYYYIDLWTDVINGTMTEEAMNYFIANKDKYSFIFYDCGIAPEKESLMRRFQVGGDVEYGYAQIGNGGVSPVAIITGIKTLSDTQLEYLNTKTKYWGEVITSVANESISIDYANKADITFIMDGDELKSNIFTESDTIVYPRIEVNSPFLKNASDQLIIKLNDVVLENYTDYYISTDDNKYYITIRPEALPLGTMRFNFQISFALSNADTSIYLDSLQVLKENAYPRVSYGVEPGVMDESFLYTAYDRLNQIVNINDFELMLENVQGYISELHINPDKMWETTFEVKNYRNKFEDLFSSIVAQTEEMKKSAYSIGLAANGFNTDGTISADTLSQSLSNNFNIFQAYLESGFDDSTVVRNQLQSIWDEAGAIINDATRTLYGARITTVKNAAYLASFREDVKSALTPSYYKGNHPTDFKPGDIWEDNEGNRYIATTFEGFTKTYDGTLAAIEGAALSIDAVNGKIEVLAANAIEMKSGGNIYIAANENVDIVGNKEVNIGGTTINIGAASVDGAKTIGGINIVSSYYNDEDIIERATSKVLIHPDKIEMGSANIIMKGANKIQIITSANTLSSTSAISLSPSDGIWIGSGAGVKLYSGNIHVEENSDGTFSPKDGTGATVELTPAHLLLGASNTTSTTTAIEMTEDFIVIAAGNQSRATNVTGVSGGLIGAKFTKDSIGFAVLKNNQVSAILMDSKGVTIGGGINVTKSTDDLRAEDDDTHGSYVRIATDGISLGSMADLYVNTNNVKLQTNASASDGSNTILAIGTNLQNINVNTDPTTLNNTGVQLLVNKKGLYASGTIYANAGKIGGWTIGSNYIGSGDTQSNSSVGLKMYTTTEGTPNLKEVAFWAGRINPDGGFEKDNLPFYVTHNGELKASKATITGEIKAGSVITGTLQAGSIITDDVWLGSSENITVQNTVNILSDAQKLAEDKDPATYFKGLAKTSEVLAVANGETGLAFSRSDRNVYAQLNDQDGLIIIGEKDKNENKYPFFRVTNDAMGFFRTSVAPTYTNGNSGTLNNFSAMIAEGKSKSLLYYQDGDMYLAGIVYANGGWFGNENGWVIGGDSPITIDNTTFKTGGMIKSANGKVIIGAGNTETGDKKIEPFILFKGSDDKPALQYSNGNISIRGTIYATGGEFTGSVTATEFHSENGIISLNSIAGMNSGETLSNTLTNLDSKAEGSRITKIESKYFATTSVMSDSEIKSSSLVWSDTAQAAKTRANIADGVAYYLWTRTTTSYGAGNSDSAYSTSYVGADGATGPQGQKGDKGDTGNYVTAIRNIYYLTNSLNVSAPDNHNSISTTSTATNTWTTRVPTYSDNYVYWRCEEYTWNENIDDDKYSYSTPYPDYGITTANRTATTASADARAARDVTDPIDSSGLEFNKSWGGKTWDVALLSAAHYTEETDPDKKYGGILIGANQGIWIAKGSTYGNGAAVAIDSSGIGMNAASITLTAEENGNTSVLSLSGGGIDLGTSGDITMGGGNISLTSGGGISLTGGSIALTSGDNYFNVTPNGINGYVEDDNSAITFGSGDNTLSIYNNRITGTEAEFTTLYVDQIGSSDKNNLISINDLLNHSIKTGTGPINSTTCPPGTIYLLYTTSGTSSEPENYTFDGGYYGFDRAVPSSGLQRTISQATKSLNPPYKYVVQYKIGSGSQGFSKSTLNIVIGNGSDYKPRETIQTVSISMSNNSSYSPSGEVSLTSNTNYINGNGRISFFFDKTTNSDVYFSNLKLTVYGTNPNGATTGPQLCTVYYNPDA